MPTMLYAACPEKWSFLSGGGGGGALEGGGGGGGGSSEGGEGCGTRPPLSEFSGSAPDFGQSKMTGGISVWGKAPFASKRKR